MRSKGNESEKYAYFENSTWRDGRRLRAFN